MANAVESHQIFSRKESGGRAEPEPRAFHASSSTPSSAEAGRLRAPCLVLLQDIIQLRVSCPSDKEEEKSTRDGAEKEEKEKSKDKAPRKMLSRGQVLL